MAHARQHLVEAGPTPLSTSHRPARAITLPKRFQRRARRNHIPGGEQLGLPGQRLKKRFVRLGMHPRDDEIEATFLLGPRVRMPDQSLA